MGNLNKTFLIGNITRDIELKEAGGTSIASFGLAINRNWTAKDGEKKEEVCFVEITVFGKRAGVISQYFAKGDPIFIEGRLQFNQWETKDGQKRNTLRVVMENFQFIGGNSGSGADASVDNNKGEADNEQVDIGNEEIPF